MIIVLISVIGAMIIAGVYSYLLSLPILFYCCFQQVSKLVMVFYLV